MKQISILLAIILGLGLALAWTAGLARAEAGAVQLAGTVIEMDLAPAGDVFDLNPDAAGNLWLSDYAAAQIWQFTPGTNVYTIYHGMTGVDDAQRDASGAVWWADFDTPGLGRISLAGGTLTKWTLPGAVDPWGLDFTAAGEVWLADVSAPLLHHFSFASMMLCSYPLPDAGASNYVREFGGKLWMVDYINDRLVQFDPAAAKFTYWTYPGDMYSYGLEFDAAGNLWWADALLYEDAVGFFQPALNQATVYTSPVGTELGMIALQGQLVWYTEWSGAGGSFTVMNPTQAASTVQSLTPVLSPVITPTCTSLGVGVTTPLVTSGGTGIFASNTVTLTVDGKGFTSYALPDVGQAWDILPTSKGVWVVDYGRDKLMFYPFDEGVFLPAIFRP